MTETRPQDSIRHRAGVVVPPENPTVEPEMRALLPTAVATFTTRLPVVDADLEGRLRAYNDSLDTMAAAFGGMALDSVYLACTGSSYLVGPDGDDALSAPLSTGPAQPLTAADAICQVLRELRRRRVLVVSPYPDWLTERAVAYWTAAGFEVSAVEKVAAPQRIYAITSQDVAARLRELSTSGSDVILLSGTGMPTVDAIAEVGTTLGVPVISSSVAAACVLTQRARLERGLVHDLMRPWR